MSNTLAILWNPTVKTGKLCRLKFWTLWKCNTEENEAKNVNYPIATKIKLPRDRPWPKFVLASMVKNVACFKTYCWREMIS